MYLSSPLFDIADAVGQPIAGAKARFYVSGTTNNATTYSDAALTTPNTNPVIADSAGRFPPIYLNPDVDYRLQVLDANNAILADRDPIFTAGEAGTALISVESNVSVVRLLATGNLSPASIVFNSYLNSISEVRSDYAGRFIIATSADGSTYTNQYTSGTNENTTTYLVPAGTTFVRARVYRAGGTTTLLAQTVVSVVRDGIDGASGSGTDAVVVNLSKSSAAVFAYADGTVPDFADIDGQVTVFKGAANETASATFSAAGSGLTGTINTATNTPVSGKPKGYYRVTAMSQDIGALVITATYDGVAYERSFSVSKVRTGYEIVGALPSTNLFEGRMVFLTTDDKLYRYTGSAWTTAVPAVDITGQIVAAQIADAAVTTAKFAASIEPVTLVSSVPGTKSTSSIFNTTDGFLYRWNGSAYVKSVPTTDLSGTIVEAQIANAALTTAKFAASIEPVTLVTSVPGTKSTNSVFNTTNGFMYRWNGSAYVKTVPTTDLTGTIANSQIDAVAASKITGTLTDAQIADLAAAKITGTLTNAQIADLAATKITGTLSDAQIAAVAAAKVTGTLTNAQIADLAATKITGTLTNAQIADVAAAKVTGTLTNSQIADLAATKITGTLTNSQIADLATSKLTGTITETQIGANAVTAAKIAAGAVETAKLAANAVTANEIAANAITAVKISAGAVETAKIAAGAVTADTIATNAITAVKISAGAVETAKIAAGAITADTIAADAIITAKIAAGAVETAKIAAGAVTADTIATNAITAVKISSGAVETAKLAVGAVTADTIASNAITTAKIAAGAVETAKLAAGAVTANEIAANAITTAKIEAGAVITAKIAAGAVTANEIGANAITAAKISAGAVETAKIAAGAITATQIAANTITAAQIAAATITSSQIATDTITAGNIAAGAISADEIAAGAITTAKIAAGAVTATQIAANTITAGQIAAATITATQIATGTITATQIAADTITAGQIAAGAISTDELAANAVTAAKIAVGTITANELAANSVTAGKIEAGAITAGKIATNAVTADKIEAGAVTAAKISVTELAAMSANTGALSVNSTLTIGTTGKIISSGATYNSNGIFLGYDVSTYKFSVGGTSGRLTFDGTNLSIPGGLIVAGTVATDAIATNAITTGVSGETDASLTLSTSWQDAVTASITVPTGAEVDIHFSLALFGTVTSANPTGGSAFVRILRDTTEIYSSTKMGSLAGYDGTAEYYDGGVLTLTDFNSVKEMTSLASAMDFDSPGAGTFTYKIQVQKDAGLWTVEKRKIKLILRKR